MIEVNEKSNARSFNIPTEQASRWLASVADSVGDEFFKNTGVPYNLEIPSNLTSIIGMRNWDEIAENSPITNSKEIIFNQLIKNSLIENVFSTSCHDFVVSDISDAFFPLSFSSISSHLSFYESSERANLFNHLINNMGREQFNSLTVSVSSMLQDIGKKAKILSDSLASGHSSNTSSTVWPESWESDIAGSFKADALLFAYVSMELSHEVRNLIDFSG